MTRLDTGDVEQARRAIHTALAEIAKDLLLKLGFIALWAGGLMGAGIPAWAIVVILGFVAMVAAES